MPEYYRRPSQKKKIWITILVTLVILTVVAFSIQPIRERILYRWDETITRLFFLISPPEKSVFVPGQQLDNMVKQTLTAVGPTMTLTPAVSATPGATATAKATLAPLPPMFILDTVPYVDQHYGTNNCAPANLAMQLAFWGWTGKREDISKAVKPFESDKNVMPYELVDYVNENTDLKAIVRLGGTEELLKRVISLGFPVIIEKGVFFRDTSGRVSWMGHYNVVLGYDDQEQEFITHDSYILPDGKFKHFTYEDIKKEWRAFNYLFMIVYPQDQWDLLSQALGPYSDEVQSYSVALSINTEEIGNTEGNDHFFALFNRGTILQKQQDYIGAATVYDEAYRFYTSLAEATRPYRMTWYQTGPYYAYFYSGRYQDLINLATTTLKTTNQPYLEESYYWRAKAEMMLGQNDEAVKDVCESLKSHPDFSPSVALLKDLGVTSCK